MRSLRITIGLAAALLALCLTAASASAKEKKVFGEFVASVHGQNLEEHPAKLQQWKEDYEGGEEHVTGLELGNVKFGKWVRSTGEPEQEEPCAKSKLSGLVNHEHSSELQATLSLKGCYSNPELGGVVEENKKSNLKLALRFKSNFSAEVGASESQLEIEKEAVVIVKDGLHKCPIIVPQQTIPFKDSPEREYEEVVAYEDETPEPIEHFETSKKLKEEFPTGLKNRIEIELGERFKGIRAYVSQEPPCSNKKGTENPTLTEYKGKKVLEYKHGHIFADFEGMEVKDGELEFVAP